MDQPPSNYTWLQMVLFPALASIGGALGHVLRTLDAGKHVSLWRTLLESLAAGFVGCLVMLLCQALGTSPQITGVVVGVCGWLGATVSIRMLEKWVRKWMGIAGDPGDGTAT
ncbi:MAG: phage holin family protein [Rhodanobacter sp.]|nr:phage holin family protein [Rhodanobacter sp.]